MKFSPKLSNRKTANNHSFPAFRLWGPVRPARFPGAGKFLQLFPAFGVKTNGKQGIETKDNQDFSC
jgi:hypothetical protein